MNPHFESAFNKTMVNEGGFVLHKNEGDRGGWTYAGIAENFWPNWPGWPIVRQSQTDPRLTPMVKEFYKTNFWDKMRLDEVENETVSYNMFDFGMNAGHIVAVKLAQAAVGAVTDGIIGPNTIGKLNAVDAELFEAKYALCKIERYIAISRKKDSPNRRFFRGWVIRTLNVAKS